MSVTTLDGKEKKTKYKVSERKCFHTFIFLVRIAKNVFYHLILAVCAKNAKQFGCFPNERENIPAPICNQFGLRLLELQRLSRTIKSVCSEVIFMFNEIQ